MFRYLIVGILVAAAVIGSQLYLNQPGTQPEAQPLAEAVGSPQNSSAESNQTSQEPPAPEDVNSFVAGNPDVEDPSLVATNTSQFDPNEPIPDPWENDESLPETPARYVNRGIDARPLTMNKRDIAKLSIGDTVKLPVPQTAQDYAMTVKEVGRHRNGDKSLKGQLVANPSYTVVMTEGRYSTFATINTPEGAFLLEASGSQGWMLSMTDLDAMIDPNLKDYQIPDITRDGITP